MNNLNYYDRDEITNIVKSNIGLVDVVLDIGCGIRPQEYMTPLIHICCEPYEEYRKHLDIEIKKRMSCLYLILPIDWRGIVETIPTKSVDTVFLLDVIEHLEKEEGAELLELTERIVRKQIIIFTPLGYMPQEHSDGIDAWGLKGGAWQTHKSGWTPEDFNENWIFFICKDYHQADHNGILFAKPYGAFWAIKNFQEKHVDLHDISRDLFGIYNSLSYNYHLLLENILEKVKQLLLNSRSQMDSINQKYSAIESQYSAIESQYSAIESQYSAIESQYSAIESQYSVLLSKYNEIYNSEFSRLDRFLQKHLFIRIILRSIYRIIKFTFKKLNE